MQVSILVYNYVQTDLNILIFGNWNHCSQKCHNFMLDAAKRIVGLGTVLVPESYKCVIDCRWLNSSALTLRCVSS